MTDIRLPRFGKRFRRLAAVLALAIALPGCVIVPWEPYHHHYWR